MIQDEKRFAEAVSHAGRLASAGPNRALRNTAHDARNWIWLYRVRGNPAGIEEQAVRRFVEKPPLEQATEYVAAGNYLWNSGMFCFTARAMLDALQRHAPEVLAAARTAVECGVVGRR